MNLAISDWVGFAGQMLATIVGGAIVIIGNELGEKRRKQRHEDEDDDQEQAVFSGVFAIRNFVVEQVNAFDIEPQLMNLGSLKIAKDNLEHLIIKSPANNARLLIVLIGLSLRLQDLISMVEKVAMHRNGHIDGHAAIFERINRLIVEFEMFEIFASSSLPIESYDDHEDESPEDQNARTSAST